MKRNIISLEIPDDMKEKLKKESKDREMSVSGLIRLIIKQYFKERNDV